MEDGRATANKTDAGLAMNLGCPIIAMQGMDAQAANTARGEHDLACHAWARKQEMLAHVGSVGHIWNHKLCKKGWAKACANDGAATTL